jgi:xanthine dehydrogenase accessory factor
VVTLTHDPKLDDPALDLALGSGAFFIGSLGSRKTHAARLERLAALGHAPDALARIRGPVGLAIGAVTAPEIALSILAEIVAARRGAALAKR